MCVAAWMAVGHNADDICLCTYTWKHLLVHIPAHTHNVTHTGRGKHPGDGGVRSKQLKTQACSDESRMEDRKYFIRGRKRPVRITFALSVWTGLGATQVAWDGKNT
jgi:hypothetical protein